MNTASVLRIGELAKENQQLREQLAAERLTVKTLLDALKTVAQWDEYARDALAKLNL